MRWLRAMLAISVLANLCLALALWLAVRTGTHKVQPTQSTILVTNLTRTNIVVQRQFFHWRQIESPDYATYISNLIDIGCPETTIRDIIVADVNQLYARKLASRLETLETELLLAETPPEPLPSANQVLRELDRERRALLDSLLGTNWIAADTPWTNAFRQIIYPPALDGDVLGLLPTEKKLAVRRLYVDTWRKIQAYVEGQRRVGARVDPARIIQLESQMRGALAALLTPDQLTEFMFRHSTIGKQLRARFNELKYFEPSPQELRRLFQALYEIESELASLPTGDNPGTRAARTTLEKQRDTAIRSVLGEARYNLYKQLQDPLFLGAMDLAVAAGKPDAASTIHQLLLAYRDELGRLTNQPLPEELMRIKTLELQLEVAKAVTAATTGQSPEEAAPPKPKIRHRVEPGETIDKLLARYGVSMREVLDANPGLDLRTVKPGDVILVPVQQ